MEQLHGRKPLALLLAGVLALSAACGDALEADEAREGGAAPATDAAELRAEIVALDARIATIEARLGAIADALGAEELADLGEELALLAEQIRAIEGDPTIVALDAIDPLFCVDPAQPQYPTAQFDFYVRGIPICGIFP